MVTTWNCGNCGATCDEEAVKCALCSNDVCPSCGDTCDDCLTKQEVPTDAPGLNAYEAKQAARRQRLLAAADRADRASQAAFERNRRIADMIPPGQPILVGHHSEGRHRRDLKRMDDAMRRAIEEGKRAEELRRLAEGVGSGGISSDDPDAIQKLRAELAELEALHKRHKAINKAILCKDRCAALAALGITPEAIEKLLTPDSMGSIGFPSYVFRNRNGNMRRIRLRIEELERRATQAPAPERRVGDVRVVDNVALNRLQLFFPGKPEKTIRSKLKSYGFRWTPSLGCWQAFRSPRATWATTQILGAPQEDTPAEPPTCILPPASDPDDCTTHAHEPPPDPPAPESGECPDGAG